MDPLSIAAGATSLAAFVGKLSLAAYNGVEQVKGAEGSLRNLGSELKSLQATLDLVAACLKKANVKEALHKAVSKDEASAQLRSIQDVVNDCERAVGELNSVLNGVSTGRFTSPGIIRSTTMAWNIKAKTAELDSLRNATNAYNRTIQIHLQVMTLIVTVDNSSVMEDVDHSLGQIKDQIIRLRLQMEARQDSQSGPAKVLSEAAIKKSLSTSETVVSTASEYFGSIAGTVRDDNTALGISARIKDHDATDVKHLGDWLSDQHFEEVSDEEDLDKNFASEVLVIAMEAYERKDYVKAERFLHEFFSLVEKIDDSWDKNELCSAYEKLASCHFQKKDYVEAVEVLQTAITKDDASVPTMRAQLQFYHAQAEYMLSNYSDAKRIATESMGMSRKDKDRSLYHNIVSLLADICEANGDDIEAEVYRRRVPSLFQPKRIEGWLAPSKHNRSIDSAESDAHSKGHVAEKELEQATSKNPEPRSQSTVPSSIWRGPRTEAEIETLLGSISKGAYAKEEMVGFHFLKQKYRTVIITGKYILLVGNYRHYRQSLVETSIKQSSVKMFRGDESFGGEPTVRIMYKKGLLSPETLEVLIFENTESRNECLRHITLAQDMLNI